MNSPALSIICHITLPSPAKFMTPVKNHTLLITTMMGILKARQVHLYNYKYSTRLAIKKQQNKIESQHLVDTHEESSKAKSLFVFLLLSFPNLLPFNFDQSIVIIGMHISYDLHIPIHSNPFESIQFHSASPFPTMMPLSRRGYPVSIPFSFQFVYYVLLDDQ